MVTRLIKWSVAEHNLPSDSFPIHSLRSGGATCLYHAGVDLEFIRRFGRWKSNTFSIYLHFDDKVLRKLSSCLMESEGLMSQLKVCTDQGKKMEHVRTGEHMRVTTQEPVGAESDGQPFSCPPPTQNVLEESTIRMQEKHKRTADPDHSQRIVFNRRPAPRDRKQ